MSAIQINDTVRINPAFANPKERDMRLTVTAVEQGAITAQIIGSGKVLKLAAQAFVLAD